MAASFDLSEFDVDVLLLALAPEIDLRYESLYAYLQDDVARRRPSVDPALNLMCGSPAERLAAALAPLLIAGGARRDQPAGGPGLPSHQRGDRSWCASGAAPMASRDATRDDAKMRLFPGNNRSLASSGVKPFR